MIAHTHETDEQREARYAAFRERASRRREITDEDRERVLRIDGQIAESVSEIAALEHRIAVVRSTINMLRRDRVSIMHGVRAGDLVMTRHGKARVKRVSLGVDWEVGGPTEFAMTDDREKPAVIVERDPCDCNIPSLYRGPRDWHTIEECER